MRPIERRTSGSSSTQRIEYRSMGGLSSTRCPLYVPYLSRARPRVLAAALVSRARVDVATLERRHDVPHALILGRDVAQTTRVAALDLGSPLRITGMLERVPDAGVDDDNGESLGQGDMTVLLAAAVEQERMAAP